MRYRASTASVYLYETCKPVDLCLEGSASRLHESADQYQCMQGWPSIDLDCATFRNPKRSSKPVCAHVIAYLMLSQEIVPVGRPIAKAPMIG
jgi:hypothetical protein